MTAHIRQPLKFAAPRAYEGQLIHVWPSYTDENKWVSTLPHRMYARGYGSTADEARADLIRKENAKVDCLVFDYTRGDEIADTQADTCMEAAQQGVTVADYLGGE